MRTVKNKFTELSAKILFAAFCFCFLFAVAGKAQPTTFSYTASQPLGEPIIFGEGIISTAEDELNAAFTPDGKSLYFSKNAPGSRQGLIVVSNFEKGKWGRPEIASFSGQYSDY